jgi:hypothetical protein
MRVESSSLTTAGLLTGIAADGKATGTVHKAAVIISLQLSWQTLDTAAPKR